MQVTVREQSFEPIPAGTYQLIAEKYDVQQNKRTKEEFLSWTFRVLDEDSEAFDKTFTFGAPMSPSKKAKAYQFFIACGLEPSEEEGDFDIDTDDYLGIPFYAEVKVEKNTKGDDVNRIEWFKSVEDFEEAARKVVARVNKATKPTATRTTGQPGTRRPVRPARVAVETASDDESADESPDLDFPK